MKNQLKWGIAGTTMICHDFVTALNTLSILDHKVNAVASKDFKKSKEFAELHTIPTAHETYEELATNVNIDIVYVGVINPNHFEVTKIMLEHEKHVLCERPMGMNHSEMKTLIDLAKSKKVFLMEGIWSRCFPAYEALEKHLESSGLGEIQHVNVEFGVQLNKEQRDTMKDFGGGAIMDLGGQALQFVQFIFKSFPLSISGAGHLNENGIDESMSCVLTYSNGGTATVMTHTKVNLSNKATIIGSSGNLEINTFWAPTIFKVSVVDTTEWQLPSGGHRFNFHNSAGLSYEAEECRKCINKGLIESSKMTHEESLQLAQIQDKLRQQLCVVFPQDEIIFKKIF